MIKLPNKDKCKRKQFSRAMKSGGGYLYLEFMNPKRSWGATYYGKTGELKTRDLTPRPKIFKVIGKNELKGLYFVDIKTHKWVSHDEEWDIDTDNNYLYSGTVSKAHVWAAHNIWSLFQQDEVRHMRFMTFSDLAEEFFTELI